MNITFKQFLAESDKMQKLAKLLNVTGKDIDKIGEKHLQTILSNIGNHDFTPDSEFDQIELDKGIEVEREHTNSVLIAKLIAKDHLKEDPKYYTKLTRMETK